MSKINSANPQGVTPQSMPWSNEGPEHVQGLRRAITADASRDSKTIDSDVAPMVNDLLARLDAFVSPKAPGRPVMPLTEPIDPQQMMLSLKGAKGSLAQAIQEVSDPSKRQHLVALLQLVESHAAMKDEVVWRVSSAKR